ncbi:MAG: TetR/AcrR family transcriptional regulator [bacterium]|nr:TetR/AcrR family transcriptional regulator [bacterium]
MSEEKSKTKDRLLDAAETLFAANGFDSVSIRDLATAANVNVAAVNYHFQGKENLFQQVIVRRFVSQRDSSLTALKTILEDKTCAPTVPRVIKALVEQYLISTLASPGGSSFMMLVAREMHTQKSHGSTTFFKEMVAPVFQSYSKALMQVRPSLHQEQINWIMASVVGQIHHFIMRWHKKEAFDSQAEEMQMMIRMFPALGLNADQYIRAVTEHITAFSTAAIDSLYPKESQ